MRLKEVIAFVMHFKNNLVLFVSRLDVMEYVIWDVKQDVNLKEGDVIE